MYKRFVVALALAIPSSAFGFASKDTALDISSAFPEQRSKIQAELADGKTYSEISQQDLAKVKDALERISQTLEQPEGLDQANNAAMLKDQELVNDTLAKARKDSRLICVREKKLGSNRSTSQCTTVGARRRQAEESQNALRGNHNALAPSAN